MERSALIMLAGAVALAVFGVVLLWPASGGGRAPTADPPASSPAATASPSLRPSPSDPKQSASSGPPVSSSPAGDALAGDVSDAALQKELEGTRRANIAPSLEHRLVKLAGRVLVADLTGKGRDAFPDYFKGEPPTDRWRDVRIRAGVAEQYQNRTDAVEVHLVWAGTNPDGERSEREPSTVMLVRQATGSWSPQPISEGSN